MKNLFSLTTDEIISVLAPKSEDAIADLLQHYIPLSLPAVFEQLGYKKGLIKRIEDMGGDKDVMSLVDLTLRLCAPYLKYKISTDMMSRYSNYASPGGVFPFDQVTDFQNNFYQEENFFSELRSFMILSYVYTKSKRAGYIAKHSFAQILNLRNPVNTSTRKPPKKVKKIKSRTETETINRRLYDKLSNLYAFPGKKHKDKIKPSSFFLPTILEYTKEKLRFSSWYDGEIMLGLINSLEKKKNPFIVLVNDAPNNQSSGPLSLQPTNMLLFLKAFRHISLNNASPMNTKTCLSSEYIQKAAITDPKIFTYNQFFLERVGCLNYINALYDLQTATPLLKSIPTPLIELINCPLLRFRLSLIDYYKRSYTTHFLHSPYDLPEWDKYLTNVIRHLVLCTLPILDLVFHYLAHLATTHCTNNNASFEHSINRYFNDLVKENIFAFYQYSDSGSFIPMPTQYKMPPDVLDADYTKLVDTIFSLFLRKSFHIAKNHALTTKLKQIHDAQQDFLTKALVNYI